MPIRLRTTAWLIVLLPCLVPGERTRAGDYHDRATLLCSECHVMHRMDPVALEPGASGPAESAEVPGKLLVRDVNALCLSCHDDASRASDVVGPNRGRQPGIVRQAGSLNHVGGSAPHGTGHTLGSLDVAPGSQPPWSPSDEAGSSAGLGCVHCHDPHGSLNSHLVTYRNLRANPGNHRGTEGLVTYNHERHGTNDLARDVFVRRPLDYDESAVDFNEPHRDDSAMGRFCAGCHGLFHGVAGRDANIGGTPRGDSLAGFVRHPTAGVDLGAGGGLRSNLQVFGAHRNRVKVMSSVGNWATPGPDVTPTCITCHKAHGNDNAFGLIYRSGRGSLTENGDTNGTGLEDLCGQCHAEASPFVTKE